MPDLRVTIEGYELCISLYENYCFLESIFLAVVENAAKLAELFSVDFSGIVQKGELDLVS